MFCSRCKCAARWMKGKKHTTREIATAFRTSIGSAHGLTTKQKPKQAKARRRDPKIAARRKAVVDTIQKVYNKTAPQVKRQLQNTTHKASASTYRRDLRAVGAVALARQKGPLKSNMQPKQRVKFAKSELKEHGDNDEPVKQFFGDAKTYDLNERGARTEWVLPGQERRTRGIGHTAQVNTYLVVGPNFKFIKILPSNDELKKRKPHGKWYMMARPKKDPNEKRGAPRKEFKDLAYGKRTRRGVDTEIVIDDVMQPLISSKGFTRKHPLMLDNWTGQKSREFTFYTEEFKKLNMKANSTYSPDLNVVELGHSWIEQDMWRDGPIDNDVEALKRAIMKSFNRMDPAVILSSYKARLRECIRMEGATITSDYKLKNPRNFNRLD